MRTKRCWVSYARLRELFWYSKESGVFTWRTSTSKKIKIGACAGATVGHGYIHIEFDGHSYGAHRLAWFYVYGAWPQGQIDHINGHRDDNRFANLRDVPRAHNLQNQRVAQADNVSGFLGVSKVGARFKARIVVDGTQRQIGTFDTAEEAHEAYLRTKRQVHPGCTI